MEIKKPLVEHFVNDTFFWVLEHTVVFETDVTNKGG